MKKQNTAFTFNFLLFTLPAPLFRVSFTLMGSASGSTAQYDIRITQYEIRSIKNNKLCETNPISKRPKMNLTFYSTKNYDNKSGLLTMEKQTQNKPNQTQFYPPPADLSGVALAKLARLRRGGCFFVRASSIKNRVSSVFCSLLPALSLSKGIDKAALGAL